MPNWVTSFLTILVPPQNLDALKSDLEGPVDWPFPLDALGMEFRSPDLSNHEKIVIDGQAERLIAAFRALPDLAERPDWMPVSRKDIEAMMGAPDSLKTPIVPFSVARLLPFVDRAEFDRLFPGKMDGPFWVKENEDRAYGSGANGLIALRKDRIGVKWPPTRIEITQEIAEADGNGWARIDFTFNTPWGQISRLDRLLQPVLEKHGAKALLIWEEEDMHSGFDYINPATDTVLSEDFGQSFIEVVPDEDYPDDTFHQIDSEKLRDAVANRIDDPDF